MKFYKIINDGAFVGVGTTNDLRRFQWEHKILLICDENKAQYIQHGNMLYYDYWMNPINSEKFKYTLANICEISKEEYDTLNQMIETGEEIGKDFVEADENQEIPQAEKATIEFVRESKTKEMSNQCNKRIVSGVDVELSDGVSHHFDLTLEDQVNLLEATMQVNGGETAVQYHASGEACKLYSADDMKLIINAAANLRKYHTAYFNSLKGYINSLTNIEDVAAINYGDLIPAEYMSDVLKSLI